MWVVTGLVEGNKCEGWFMRFPEADEARRRAEMTNGEEGQSSIGA